MNIFYLDIDPKKAASYHCDKHVVKMILESAQLLSTAHRVLDGIETIDNSSGRKIKRWILNDNRESLLYKASHINHPSAVWTRSSSYAYLYLYELFVALISEYNKRYLKNHKCQKLLIPLMDPPKNIRDTNWKDPPQCMPEECKVVDNPVEAYRNYYRMHKARFAKWKNGNIPDWFIIKGN